jgi:hypothetical protein
MAVRLTDATVSELVPRANYVFRCRVLELGASNLGTVPVEDRMGIVQVEDVVIAPANVGDLTGERVTVYFTTTRNLKRGQHLTVAASSWHYGEHIGVVEEARFTEPVDRVRDAFLDARLRLQEELVEARVVHAELIVGGRVLEIRRAEREETDEPEWWEAEVRVDRVHKGRPPEEHVRVWFPIGGEREWDDAPKFFAGQEGIWLLSHGPIGEGREREPKRSQTAELRKLGIFTALDPLDFHAPGDADRIDALVLWTSRGRRKPQR